MEHSELFLLLPRYEEAEGQPDYIRLKSVMTVAEILEVIESIDEICRFIANENYEGYYDADNVSAFLYPVEAMEECYPNIKDEEIPCAGCGEWVLIDVPGVSLNEIFPIHKADEILMFGKYKGKTFGDIYKIDYQYLHWLEKTDRLFKVDFEELKQLYPDVEKQEDISIADQVIDFGKYKGQKFRDIKDDISYLEWLVSIDKISIEDFELLSTI